MAFEGRIKVEDSYGGEFEVEVVHVTKEEKFEKGMHYESARNSLESPGRPEGGLRSEDLGIQDSENGVHKGVRVRSSLSYLGKRVDHLSEWGVGQAKCESSDTSGRFAYLTPLNQYGDPSADVSDAACSQGNEGLELDSSNSGFDHQSSQYLPPSRYPCNTCDAAFWSAMDLWDHRKVCGTNSNYACTTCGKFFANRTSLRKHQYIHTDEKKFLCTECGMRFNSNGNLKRHKRTHTGERPYSCEICQKKFAQVTTLKNHMTTHTNDRPFECEVCKKRFPRKGHLTGHMGTHIDFQRGARELLSGGPASSNELTNDRDPDRGSADQKYPEIYRIPNLAATTPSQDPEDRDAPLLLGANSSSTSNDHSNSSQSSDYRPNSSRSTGMFPRIATDQRHNADSLQYSSSEPSHHRKAGLTKNANKDERESASKVHDFTQLSANTSFEPTARVSLDAEPPVIIKTHERELAGSEDKDDVFEIYVTDEPAYPAVSSGGLETRMKMSSDETVIVGTIFTGNRVVNVKHFRCNICGKILTSSNHLKEHKLIHTGGKPHRCSYCDKLFRNSGNLRRHERTHTGVRPYQCQLCGKSFTQAGTLKNHMVTHTKQKPFVCHECGEGFTRKRNLKDHTRAVHAKERPFACPFCNHRTFRQDRLNKHIDVIHGGRKGYMCTYCGRYFKTIKSLGEHRRRHQAVKLVSARSEVLLKSREFHSQKQRRSLKYKCWMCDTWFSAPLYLRRHNGNHIVLANERIMSKAAAPKHAVEISSSDPNQAAAMPRANKLESQVERLKRRAADYGESLSMPQITCKTCLHKCAPSGCLKKISKCHVCIPHRSCADCGRGFTYSQIFNYHKNIVHSKALPPSSYTCSHCDKIFVKTANFILHVQFHEKKYKHLNLPSIGTKRTQPLSGRKFRSEWLTLRPYPCSYCGEKFAFPGILNHHEQTHTSANKKEPLRDARTCTLCHQRFTHAGALFSHMKTHVSKTERPFGCQRCHKRFTRPSHLKEHMMRHSNVTFPCKICGKTFFTNRTLRKHEAKHTDYRCVHCRADFLTEGDLRLHLEMQHSSNVTQPEISTPLVNETDESGALIEAGMMLYLCQVCGSSFSDLKKLESHQRSH